MLSTVKHYFRCILISRFWNVEISLDFNLAFSQCSTRPLIGKLDFCWYLISRFYPTREIRENLMHAKNTCFAVVHLNNAFKMPRWLSGVDYVLGVLDRWIDSLYCSYLFTIFCNTTTNVLQYCNRNIAAYSVFLQRNDYITIYVQGYPARSLALLLKTSPLFWSYFKLLVLKSKIPLLPSQQHWSTTGK